MSLSSRSMFLCLALFSFASSSLVFAQEATDAAADEAAQETQRARNYPYTKNSFAQSGSTVSFGENQALAVPSWVLYLILVAFLAFIGMVVRKIFLAQEEKEKKKEEKSKAKQAKKGSKKN